MIVMSFTVFESETCLNVYPICVVEKNAMATTVVGVMALMSGKVPAMESTIVSVIPAQMSAQ